MVIVRLLGMDGDGGSHGRCMSDFPSRRPEYRRAYGQRVYADPERRAAIKERERMRQRRALGIVGDAPRPEGPCELCGKPTNGKRAMHFDHSHECGHFRGWLCAACNGGLGLFGDDTDRLQAAIDYLKRFQREHDCE